MARRTRTRPRWRLVSGALTVALLVAWFLLLRPTALGGPTTYTVVSGRSMEPTYQNGDYVVAMARDTYDVDDIIAFHAAGGIVIHRILGGSAEEGFVTRGDNNTWNDSWRPTPDEILGAAVIRLPAVGRTVSTLQQPLGLGAVAGATTTFMLIMGVDPRRRRRRPALTTTGAVFAVEDRTRSDLRNGLVELPPANRSGGPGGRVGFAVVTILLVALLTLVAVQAFRLPATDTTTVEGIDYRHHAEFAYTASVAPSTVYQGDTVGPVTAATAEVPPLYTRLVRSLDVDFTYRLETGDPARIDGTVEAVIRIQAGEDGWERTIPAVETRPITDGAATLTVRVDMEAVITLITEAEEETGHRPGLYRVTVEPVVSVDGSIGDDPLSDTYAPLFEMEVSAGRIVPVSELSTDLATTFSTSVTRPNQVALPFVTLEVGLLRWISSAALALILIAGVAVLLVGARWQRLRIKARYGSMIVPIASFDIAEDRRRIKVPSMGDLARLARAGGGVILMQESPPGVFTYTVPSEDALYEYTARV